RSRQAHGYPYYSLLPYQGFARAKIHKMKYLAGFEIAQTFGFLMALALREEPELNKIDYLVPVPLHFSRFSQRGFNQAAVIADNISRGWGKTVFDGVIRLKKTDAQAKLSLQLRQANLKGAFGLLPGHSLQGKRCLIIDDVITSGFTFQAMAQLIVNYGGKPQGAFLARTQNRGG
ncbi:MAG TPA: ComF family protein, partial [Firmicutes bacterium]|nr:ComF family protein [Bacillota bacterium]